MVKLLGFETHEEHLVTDMVARFATNNFLVGELTLIEKLDMPGYNGKVVPARIGDSDRLDMTMYLASLSPFTLAHELAHVSDISVRRNDTLDNLSLTMPASWHLAHQMSSEYYANRIACDYAGESHVFEAFQSDAIGLKMAVQSEDWGSALIYYSLLLGILHGMKRAECDPLKLLASSTHLPEMIHHAIDNFRHQAVAFFDGYDTAEALAA